MTAVRIRGRLFRGLGEGARFTEIPWAKEAFVRTLGFEPHPGTVNLRVDPAEAEETLQRVRRSEGLRMIPPADSGFCAARCYRVRIEPEVAGGLVIPHVEGYPEDVLELVAPVNVRQTLGVSDGDLLEVEVYLDEAAEGEGT